MGEGSSSSSVDKTLKLNFLEKKISGNSYISKLFIVQGAPPKYLAAKKCLIAKVQCHKIVQSINQILDIVLCYEIPSYEYYHHILFNLASCMVMLDNLHRDSDHAAILSNAFLIDTVQQQGKLHIDFTRFIC